MCAWIQLYFKQLLRTLLPSLGAGRDQQFEKHCLKRDMNVAVPVKLRYIWLICRVGVVPVAAAI
jgi:hypothetical protein